MRDAKVITGFKRVLIIALVLFGPAVLPNVFSESVSRIVWVSACILIILNIFGLNLFMIALRSFQLMKMGSNHVNTRQAQTKSASANSQAQETINFDMSATSAPAPLFPVLNEREAHARALEWWKNPAPGESLSGEQKIADLIQELTTVSSDETARITEYADALGLPSEIEVQKQLVYVFRENGLGSDFSDNILFIQWGQDYNGFEPGNAGFQF